MNNIQEKDLLIKASEMKFFDQIRITKGENGQLSGTIRKCQTTTQAVFRFFQNIVDYFQGGKKALNIQSFEHLWSTIERKMTKLEAHFKAEKDQDIEPIKSEDPFEVKERQSPVNGQDIHQLHLLKTLLKLQGVIIATKWGKSLQGNDSYQKFSERLDKLQKMANTFTKDHPNISPDLARWIRSNKNQRIFRVMTNSGDLPYLYSEIPKGAILITNLDAYKATLLSRGFSLTYNQKFRQLQKYINFIFTGSKHIHAEISLGNGRFFHQSRHNGSVIGCIEERTKDRICSHDVRIVPEEKANPEKKEIVETTIANMKQEDNRFKEIRTSFASMLRTVFYKRRSPDYQLPQGFDPNQTYACSAVVAILLGLSGTDIGELIGKRAEDISPADLARSDRLQDFYKSGL